MRVLFVTHDGASHEPLGLEYLIAACRQAGMTVFASPESGALAAIQRLGIDALCLQVITGDEGRWSRLARAARDANPRLRVVVGGPHFLFFGEGFEGADTVLRGEAEETLPSLLLGTPPPTESALIGNLDALVPPDRAVLYDAFPEIRQNPIRNFMACRGCPYRCTYCFTGDTLVHTTEGMRPIRDIVRARAMVAVLDAQGHPRIVSQFHERDYAGDLVTIDLWKHAVPLTGTPNHEIHLERGLTRLDAVQVDDWVRLPIPAVPACEPMIPPRLAGLYVAEGSISRSGRGSCVRLSFGAHEVPYIDEARALLEDWSGHEARLVTQGPGTHVEVTRRDVCDRLDDLFGHGAGTKRLPVEVFGWPLADRLDFLRAWMDGDGYKAQGRLGTASASLALQGFLLAASVGLRPSLFVREVPDSDIDGRVVRANYPCWTLAFEAPDDRLAVGAAPKPPATDMRRKATFMRVTATDVYLRVKSVTREPYVGPVFNLGVEAEHSYTAGLVGVSNCYNSNPVWLEMMHGTGLRYHDPDWLCDDIERVMRDFGGQFVSFQDDIFGVDLKWLDRFRARYRRRAFPFFAQLRPHLITDERVRMLKDAGIHIASFAVESGNEQTRQQILDRKEPNELIQRGVATLHRHGVKFRMQNLLGLPVADPLADALETLRFNIACKPTLSWCSLLQVYPGTAIADYVVKIGLVESQEKLRYLANATFFDESCLPIKNREAIGRLHKWWSAVVRWPWLYPLVRLLIHIPHGQRAERWIFDTSKQYINAREYWRVGLSRHVIRTRHASLDRLDGSPRRPEEQASCG